MNEKKKKFLARDVDRLVNPLLCSVCLFVCTVATTLPMPQNVKMEAVNDRYVLKWEWDDMWTDSSSRFTADYSLSTSSDYAVVCNQTLERLCDYTPMDLYYFAGYLLRVRAEGPAGVSEWKRLRFSPEEDASLGPPSQVDIVSGDANLMVFITEPLTSKNKSMSSILRHILFEVRYWEEQAPQQAYSKKLHQPIASLAPLKPWTMYCLQVRAFNDLFEKTSPFTTMQCVFTQGHHRLWPAFLIIIICVLLVMALFFWYHREIKELCSGYYIPTSLQGPDLASARILQLSDESCSTLDAVEMVSLCGPEEESQESDSHPAAEPGEGFRHLLNGDQWSTGGLYHGSR